jgi:hypothetical protein
MAVGGAAKRLMMMTQTDEISSELPCHACGYDLRAHPVDGNCPECGASVAEARRVAAIPARPLWRDSDARWRRRMLVGVWLWVLLPLMEFLKAFEWTSSLRVPAIFELGGHLRRLDETFLSNLRMYQLLLFCMGAGLIFSKERGRRRGRVDWTRRWGVFGSYIVMFLGVMNLVLVTLLVLVGIAALCLSIPPRFQPGKTGLFINISAGWLRYGLYPSTDASYNVFVAVSAIVVLLACIAIFDALRSCGSKWIAAIVLSPLVIFSLLHLFHVARSCLPSSGREEGDVYWLAMYFQPQILVRRITGVSEWGLPDEWLPKPVLSEFLVEGAKWGVVFLIAVWLTVAQVLAWRRGKRKRVEIAV